MQIKITDITPFMRKGWVAMDKDGAWFWFEQKPLKSIYDGDMWVRQNPCDYENISEIFDIAPVDDWTKSLICIKGKNNE